MGVRPKKQRDFIKFNVCNIVKCYLKVAHRLPFQVEIVVSIFVTFMK